MPQPVRLSILGFLGGALAVLIFHQSLWYLLNLIGLIPPERPAWPFDPIPPFGVPSVISKAFWGGVGRGAGTPALAFARWRLLGELDRHWGDRSAARRLLRGAADQGRADSGTLAAFPRLDDGQRHLGIRHGAIHAARERGTERLRWRRSRPSDGRKR
jgi:hypothetical protein